MEQSKHVLIHSFVMTVMMVCFGWFGVTDFAWQSDSLEQLSKQQINANDQVRTLPLPLSLVEAYRLLQDASQIESELLGASAVRSRQFQAFEQIKAHEQAESLFVRLLGERYPVAQAYGLLGLKAIQSELYGQQLPYFQNSHHVLPFQSGCSVFEMSVKEWVGQL